MRARQLLIVFGAWRTFCNGEFDRANRGRDCECSRKRINQIFAENGRDLWVCRWRDDLVDDGSAEVDGALGRVDGGGLDAGVDDLGCRWGCSGWWLRRGEVGCGGDCGWSGRGILEAFGGGVWVGEDAGGDVAEHLAEVSEGGGHFKFPNSKWPNGK